MRKVPLEIKGNIGRIVFDIQLRYIGIVFTNDGICFLEYSSCFVASLDNKEASLCNARNLCHGRHISVF